MVARLVLVRPKCFPMPKVDPNRPVASGGRSFGPIAPPASSQSSMSNNPYSSLKVEDHVNEDDEEEDDTITWKGRRN